MNIKRFFTLFSACLSGYLGENCKIECPSPYYGWKCMNKCNCDNQECHHVNGCRLQADQNNNFNITTTPERYIQTNHSNILITTERLILFLIIMDRLFRCSMVAFGCGFFGGGGGNMFLSCFLLVVM